MMTKKIVFWVALVTFIVVFGLANPLMFGLCRNITAWGTGVKYCNDTPYISKTITILGLYLSVMILFFSLVTYKIRDEVFYAWLNFAYWWVPLTIFLAIITPNENGGWGIPSLISPGVVAFAFVAIFTIVSLLIIPIKYLKLRGKWN